MALIQFTRNFNDESTGRGFQFVFMCDRCGNGYRTRFQPSATGAISGALDAAGSLLGGLFYRAADAGRAVHSAAWEKAHDAAFEKAVQEAMPHFHKCKRCGPWVDDDCWNTPRNLCKGCAPDLRRNSPPRRLGGSAGWEKARRSATSASTFKETIVASCPHGAAVSVASSAWSAASRSRPSFAWSAARSWRRVQFCAECGARQGKRPCAATGDAFLPEHLTSRPPSIAAGALFSVQEQGRQFLTLGWHITGYD